MASERIPVNDNDRATDVCAGPEVGRAVRELLGAAELGSEQGADGLVKRAMAMLDAVSGLLQALSPTEIESAAHTQLRAAEGTHVVYWKVFGVRHRVLTDVFATQKATFARLSRAHFEARKRGPA